MAVEVTARCPNPIWARMEKAVISPLAADPHVEDGCDKADVCKVGPKVNT